MLNKLKCITFVVGASSALVFNGCGTMTLQTNVKMTKSVFLKPTKQDKKSVYISLKNISGENLNILPLLKEKLKQKNYIIIENSSDANYVLMVNILFANNLKEANALKASVGSGIATGAIAAGSGSHTGGSLLIGASVALASGLVAKALEDETYRAVVDVVINEKLNNFKSDTDAVMGKGYKEQTTRVLAEAVQTNLKLDTALPILSKKIATQLSNIF